MKIVNREQFLQLPEGTVYAKQYESDGFGQLCIKYETRKGLDDESIDWLYINLNDFDDWDKSEELYEKMDEMRDKGKEYPLKLDSVQRDGFFEQDQMFAIYDKDDVNLIISRLQNPLDD